MDQRAAPGELPLKMPLIDINYAWTQVERVGRAMVVAKPEPDE
jgi:hypothetical protein